MNDFLHPIKASVSPIKLSERDKQKRIHSWLGEQTADYLKAAANGTNFSSKTSTRDVHNPYVHDLNGAFYHGGERGNDVTHSLQMQPHIASGQDPPTEDVHSFVNHESPRKSLQKLNPEERHQPRVTFQSNVFANANKRLHKAATTIQALWRGYYARRKNLRVVEVRHEIRARRAEQYITTLCNEVSALKQRQKADLKLRELQTEAIRFMWSQMREMQGKFDSKFTKLEEKFAEMKVAEEIVSQSSASKDNTSIEEVEEKEKLKDAVGKLQEQVIQLQDALLSFSDRLVTESEDVVVTNDIYEDKDKIHENKSTSKSSDLDDESHCSEEDVVDDDLPPSFRLSVIEDDVVLSARDNIPKITVQNILEALDSSLTEKELWSVCEQASIALKSAKKVNMKYLCPSSVYIRKDGLISFNESDVSTNATYCSPELLNEGQAATIKSLIFSLAVTIWSAADFNMTEDQAPCLSTPFENLLVRMSQDDPAERADVDEVLQVCAEHHSSINCNSLQTCASLYAETCDMKKGKKRHIKSVSFTELFAKEIVKTRCDFQSNVVPQINKLSFKLKPAVDRQLSPKPKQDKSLYENFLEAVKTGVTLKKQNDPKLYTVKDMFRDNPELIQKLNILPGQRRKNMMAVKHAMKKLSASDGKQMFPSAPQSLRAEVKSLAVDFEGSSGSKSLILRWHPSHIMSPSGSKVKSGSILGYRIYVNRQPKGMVNGIKCRALLDGLKKSGEYRIYVCAVSALGESDPSNTVIANLETELVSTFPASPKYSKTHHVHTKSFEAENLQPLQVEKSVDVVERVLQRYGIKKSPASPSTSLHSIQQQNLGPLPNTLCHDFKKPTTLNNPTTSSRAFLSGVNADILNNDYAASSSSSDDHITPRTKALLDQLKDELLG